MARQSIALSLTNVAHQGVVEGVVIHADGKWESPDPQGWLRVQKGLWVPNIGNLGLELHPVASDEKLALLKSLKFAEAKVGKAGEAQYITAGEEGGYTVTIVNDV